MIPPKKMKSVSFSVADDKLYMKFREICALKGLEPYKAIAEAMRLWLAALTDGDIFSLPPYNTINRNLVKEFRLRCAQNNLDFISGMADAMVVWNQNFSFTDPYPRKKRGGKKRASARGKRPGV